MTARGTSRAGSRASSDATVTVSDKSDAGEEDQAPAPGPSRRWRHRETAPRTKRAAAGRAEEPDDEDGDRHHWTPRRASSASVDSSIPIAKTAVIVKMIAMARTSICECARSTPPNDTCSVAGQGEAGRRDVRDTGPGRERQAEITAEALHVARPGCGGRAHADAVFEDQVPTDDPSHEFTERRVRVRIGAACHGHHRRQFRIAKRNEYAGQAGQRERGDDTRAGHVHAGADRGEDAPSIVPSPTPISPATPSTRRSGTPSAARTRSCGCVATSCFQTPRECAL